ncbi:MAG: hypothetical protein LBR23_06520 [Spirochaetaceae bacterium]|jgi:hypothetical protein|nr:hypothetical protein [Spirochaetaceae bacterium]
MKKLSLILGAIALVLIAMLTLGCENAAEGDTKIEYVDKLVPAGSIAPTINAIHVLSSSGGSTKLLVVLDPATVSGSIDLSQFGVTITGVHDEQELSYDYDNDGVDDGEWGVVTQDYVTTLELGAEVGPSDKITITTYGYSGTTLTTKTKAVTVPATVPALTIPEMVTLRFTDDKQNAPTNTLTTNVATGTTAIIYKVVYSSNAYGATPSVSQVTGATVSDATITLPAVADANTYGDYVVNGVKTTNGWDKLAPAIESIKATRTAINAASVFVSADEYPLPASPYKVSTDGTTYGNAASNANVSSVSAWDDNNKTYTVYVKVVDAAGNESAAKSVTVNKFWSNSNAPTIGLTGLGSPILSTGLDVTVSNINGTSRPSGLTVTVELTDKYNRTIIASQAVAEAETSATVNFSKAKADSLADGIVTARARLTASGYDIDHDYATDTGPAAYVSAALADELGSDNAMASGATVTLKKNASVTDVEVPTGVTLDTTSSYKLTVSGTLSGAGTVKGTITKSGADYSMASSGVVANTAATAIGTLATDVGKITGSITATIVATDTNTAVATSLTTLDAGTTITGNTGSTSGFTTADNNDLTITASLASGTLKVASSAAVTKESTNETQSVSMSGGTLASGGVSTAAPAWTLSLTIGGNE